MHGGHYAISGPRLNSIMMIPSLVRDGAGLLMRHRRCDLARRSGDAPISFHLTLARHGAVGACLGEARLHWSTFSSAIARFRMGHGDLCGVLGTSDASSGCTAGRSEGHTSELQS